LSVLILGNIQIALTQFNLCPSSIACRNDSSWNVCL